MAAVDMAQTSLSNDFMGIFQNTLDQIKKSKLKHLGLFRGALEQAFKDRNEHLQTDY